MAGHHIRNCHIDLGLIGGGENNLIHNLDNESDLDNDDTDSDDDIVEVTKTNKPVKNSLFTEKQWGDDDGGSDPAGINFKSKLPEFKKSVETLKKLYRKGSVKVLGKIKSHTEEVKRKDGGTEVKINITDPDGEGEVNLSFWGPHKKTRVITVQVNSIKGSDKRFVKLFADKFIRELLEKL